MERQPQTPEWGDEQQAAMPVSAPVEEGLEGPPSREERIIDEGIEYAGEAGRPVEDWVARQIALRMARPLDPGVSSALEVFAATGQIAAGLRTEVAGYTDDADPRWTQRVAGALDAYINSRREAGPVEHWLELAEARDRFDAAWRSVGPWARRLQAAAEISQLVTQARVSGRVIGDDLALRIMADIASSSHDAFARFAAEHEVTEELVAELAEKYRLNDPQARQWLPELGRWIRLKAGTDEEDEAGARRERPAAAPPTVEFGSLNQIAPGGGDWAAWVITSGIAAADRERRPIDDRTAFRVAEALALITTPALREFAATGTIDRVGIEQELLTVSFGQTVEGQRLVSRFAEYCSRRGSRGPVDHWHEDIREQEQAQAERMWREELFTFIDRLYDATMDEQLAGVEGLGWFGLIRHDPAGGWIVHHQAGEDTWHVFVTDSDDELTGRWEAITAKYTRRYESERAHLPPHRPDRTGERPPGDEPGLSDTQEAR